MSRGEWVECAKIKLDQWDHAVDQLQAKAANAQLRAKSGVQAQLDATKASLRDARVSWAKVKGEANEVWEAVGEEIGAAWEVNRAAIERSIDEIRSALT